MRISKGNETMNDLIARLKVTHAAMLGSKPAKVAPVASIKMPGATTASVAPIVSPVAGNEPKNFANANSIIEAGIRNKMAECKPKVDIGIDENIIAKYREEYQQFLKELETMDFSSMIFGEKPAESNEVAPAPVAQEEVPLANGISVGEEAGDSVVIAAPKKSRKKKAITEEVQTEPVEAPVEVTPIEE
jgi:hypothetical protein